MVTSFHYKLNLCKLLEVKADMRSKAISMGFRNKCSPDWGSLKAGDTSHYCVKPLEEIFIISSMHMK